MKIIQTIFRTIREGTIRDGRTTIPGLGRFYLYRYGPTCKKSIFGQKYVPARTVIKFKPCVRIRQSLYDKEE